MERTPVKSSSIKSVGHEGETLEVEFKSGAVYTYHGVPASEHQALMGAGSIGKHFAANIKAIYASTAGSKVQP